MKWTIRSIFPKKRSKSTGPESSDVPSKSSYTNSNHDDVDTNPRQSSCQGGAAPSADFGGGVGSSSHQNGTPKNRDTMIVHDEPEAYDPRTIREIIRVQQHLNRNDEETEESLEGIYQNPGTSRSELVTTPLKPRPQSDSGAFGRKCKRFGSESSLGSTKCTESPEAQSRYSPGGSQESKCGHEPRATHICMKNQPRGSITPVHNSGNPGGGNGGRNDVGGNSGTVHPIENGGKETRSQATHPRRVGRSIYGQGNPYLLCGSPLLKINDRTHISPFASGDGGYAPDADATELITRPIRFETSSECRDRLEKRVASALSSARSMTTTPLGSQGSKAPYSSPSLTAFGGKTQLSDTIPLSPCPSSSESDEPDTESSTIDRRMRKGSQGQRHRRRYSRRPNSSHKHTSSIHDNGNANRELNELESVRHRNHAQEPLSEPIYGQSMAGFSAFNIGHSTDHTLSTNQRNLSRSRAQDDCPLNTEGCSWPDERAVARTRDLYSGDLKQYIQDHSAFYRNHPNQDARYQEIYKQACKFAEMMAEARRLAMQSAPLNEQFTITFEQISESSGDDQPWVSSKDADKGKGKGKDEGDNSPTDPAMTTGGFSSQSHPPASSRMSQASSIPVPTRLKRRQQRQSLPTFIARGATADSPLLLTDTNPKRHSNNTSRCTARRIIYTDELARGLPKGHIARENHYEIVQSPREPCGAGVGIGYPNRLSIAPVGSATIVIRPGGAVLSSSAPSRSTVPGTAFAMDRTRSSTKSGECPSAEDPCAGSSNDHADNEDDSETQKRSTSSPEWGCTWGRGRTTKTPAGRRVKPRLYKRLVYGVKRKARNVLRLFTPTAVAQQAEQGHNTCVYEDMLEKSARDVIERESVGQTTHGRQQHSIPVASWTMNQQSVTEIEGRLEQPSVKKVQWSPITSRIQSSEIPLIRPVEMQSLMVAVESMSWSSSISPEGIEDCVLSAKATLDHKVMQSTMAEEQYGLQQSHIDGSSLVSVQPCGDGQSVDNTCAAQHARQPMRTTYCGPSASRPRSLIAAALFRSTASRPSSSSLLITPITQLFDSDGHEACTAVEGDVAEGDAHPCDEGTESTSAAPTRTSMVVIINGMTPEELINSIRFEFDQEGSPGYYGPREYERDQARRRQKAFAEKQRKKQQAAHAATNAVKIQTSPSSSLSLLTRSLSSSILETVSNAASTVWRRATTITSTKPVPLSNTHEQDNWTLTASVTNAHE